MGGGPKRTIFSSVNDCCANVVWASTYLIAFVQNFTIKTVDLRTGRASLANEKRAPAASGPVPRRR